MLWAIFALLAVSCYVGAEGISGVACTFSADKECMCSFPNVTCVFNGTDYVVEGMVSSPLRGSFMPRLPNQFDLLFRPHVVRLRAFVLQILRFNVEQMRVL
jgi:hypothetical protein